MCRYSVFGRSGASTNKFIPGREVNKDLACSGPARVAATYENENKLERVSKSLYKNT